MTIKDDAIAMRQTRRANLDFLEAAMQAAYRKFRGLKTLLEQQKDFSLSDAIDMIEASETLEAIDITNIAEKLAALNEGGE